MAYCNAERRWRGLVPHASLQTAAGPPAGLDVIADRCIAQMRGAVRAGGGPVAATAQAAAAAGSAASTAAAAAVGGLAPLPFGAVPVLGGARLPGNPAARAAAALAGGVPVGMHGHVGQEGPLAGAGEALLVGGAGASADVIGGGASPVPMASGMEGSVRSTADDARTLTIMRDPR